MVKARALILAAGQGSRMNAVKALLPLPLPNGGECSALEGLAQSYVAAGVADLLVVTGFHAPAVEEAARALGLQYVRNTVPEQGMFSSVQTGLRACASQKDRSYSHIFVHPVDIPLVRPAALLELTAQAALEPAAVLVPAYAGRSGHPPLLPAIWAEEVAAFNGDGGLRAAWAHLPRRRVETADAFILEDMDRPEDYERLRRAAARRDMLSSAEALQLLACRNVSKRGRRHALAVGAVAAALTAALGEARAKKAALAGAVAGAVAETAPLDPDIARTGGLLHDICKGLPEHEAAAGALMRRLGLPAVAALIEKHRDLSLPAQTPLSERELVYLADKYCFGPGFVCVAERFRQKLELFASDAAAGAAVRARRGRVWEMEARLAQELGQDPALIARQALAALPALPEFAALYADAAEKEGA